MSAHVVERIEAVAVVGAGYMGGGIAQSLARCGFDVLLADVSAEATRAQRARLLTEAEDFEARGLFGPGSAAAVADHLRAAPSIEEAVAGADLVHEAVPEDVALKQQVLARASAAARPEAVVATNTSTIPVHVLAGAVAGPHRFLTVHWSNPAPFVPGVELVAGEATDPACVPVVTAMLARAGRRAAQVADTPGFVLNRLQYVLFKEAAAIVEQGVATPADVDTIVSTTFGFRLPFFGPFAVADMAGLDNYVQGMRLMEAAYGERMAPPTSLTDLVDAGHHGAKSGTGYTISGDPDRLARLIAHRNTAYARLGALLADLGPLDPPTPGGDQDTGRDQDAARERDR